MWSNSSTMFLPTFTSLLIAVSLMGINSSDGCLLDNVGLCTESILGRQGLSKNPPKVCRAVPGVAACLGFLNSVDGACNEKTSTFLTYLHQLESFCSGIQDLGLKCQKEEARVCDIPLKIANEREDPMVKCQASRLGVSCLDQLRVNCNNASTISRMVDIKQKRLHDLIRVCDDNLTTMKYSHTQGTKHESVNSFKISTTPNYISQTSSDLNGATDRESNSDDDHTGNRCTMEHVRACVPSRKELLDDAFKTCRVIYKAKLCFKTLRPKCDAKLAFYIDKGLKRIEKDEKACNRLDPKRLPCTTENVMKCAPVAHTVGESTANACQKLNTSKLCFESILPNCNDSFRTLVEQSINNVDAAANELCSIERPNSNKDTQCTVEDVSKCAPRWNETMPNNEEICKMKDDAKPCLETILPNCETPLKYVIQDVLNQFDHCQNTPENKNENKTSPLSCTPEDIQKCAPDPKKLMDITNICNVMNEVESCFDAIIPHCDDIMKTNIEGILSQFAIPKNQFCSGEKSNANTCTMEDIGKCVSLATIQDIDKLCSEKEDAKPCLETIVPNCQGPMKSTVELMLKQFDTCTILPNAENENKTSPTPCTMEDIQKCAPDPKKLMDITNICNVMNEMESCFDAIMPHCDDVIKRHIKEMLNQFAIPKNQFCSGEKSNANTCTMEDIGKCVSLAIIQDIDNLCSEKEYAKPCLENIIPNCQGPMKSTVELMLKQFDTCTILPNAENENKTSPMSCTVEDIQKCVPRWNEPMHSIEEICKVKHDTKPCLETILPNCETPLISIVQEILNQLDHCQNTPETKNENKTSSMSCTPEDIQKCAPDPKKLMDITNICNVMNEVESCFDAIIPHCDDIMKTNIEAILSQFAIPKNQFCSGEKSNANTCTMEDIGKCVSLAIIQDIDNLCSEKEDAKPCLETIVPNCQGPMKSTVELMLKQFDTCTILPNAENKNKTSPTPCTMEDIQKCAPDPKKLMDITNICNVMNEMESCFDAIMPHCDDVIKRHIKEMLNQFAIPKNQFCSGEKSNANTCTMEDIGKCVSLAIIQDIDKLCSEKEDAKPCLENIIPNCQGPMKSTVELMLKQFDTCTILPNAENENKTSPMSCTVEDIQKCVPRWNEPMHSIEEICKVKHDTKPCLETILPNCETPLISIVQEILNQLDHCQNTPETKNENKTSSMSCTPEDIQKCAPDPKKLMDITNICNVMNEVESCFDAIIPHCDDIMKTNIEGILSQFAIPKNQFCSGEKSNANTCTMEDIGKCVSLAIIQDIDNLCSEKEDAKPCLETIVPNCQGPMKSTVELMLKQFDTCTILPNAENENKTSPTPCTMEDIQKCAPDPKKLMDITNICNVMNEMESCFDAIMPHCDDVIKRHIKEMLNQFAIPKNQFCNGEKSNANTCTMEDIGKCVSLATIQDIDKLCSEKEDAKPCLETIVPNCQGPMKSTVELMLKQFDTCTILPNAENENKTSPTPCTMEDIQKCAPDPKKLMDITNICNVMNEMESCFDAIMPHCDDVIKRHIKEMLNQFAIPKNQFCSGEKSNANTCTMEDIGKCVSLATIQDIDNLCSENEYAKPCLETIVPNCQGPMKSTVELMLKQFDTCTILPNAENENKTSPMSCTVEDIQKCVPRWNEPMHSIEEICKVKHDTKPCLETILPNCETPLISIVQEILNQLDHCQNTPETKNENKTSSMSCTPEDIQKCAPDPKKLMDITNICNVMNEVESCFDAIIPHCDDIMKTNIEGILSQFAIPKNQFCSGEKSNANTCTMEDIGKCVSLATIQDIDKLCSEKEDAKPCLETIVPNCQGPMKSTVELMLKQFDTCTILPNAENENKTSPTPCTMEDIQKCAPDPKKLMDITNICNVMNEMESCFDAIMPHCDDVIKRHIKEMLNQFAIPKNQFCSGEKSNANTCTMEDIGKCVSLAIIQDIDKLCSEKEDAKPCLENIIPNCQGPMKSTVELMLKQFDTCTILPNAENENKTSPMSCTVEDIQKCVPRWNEPMHSIEEICKVKHDTKPCLETILPNCETPLISIVQEILNQLDHCQNTPETKNENKTSSMSCTPEDIQKCAPDPKKLMDITNICNVMNEVKSCFDAIMPHCDDVIKRHIKEMLNQFADQKNHFCSGEEPNANTCTMEDIGKCVSLATIQDIDKLCSEKEDAKPCLETIVPNCQGPMKSTVELMLKQFDTCTILPNAENEKQAYPTSCTIEDIQTCAPDPKKLMDITNICNVMNEVDSCFDAIMPHCDDDIKRHIKEMLSQFANQKNQFCSGEEPNANTCTMEDIGKCVSLTTIQDIDQLCSEKEDAKPCLETIVPNCQGPMKSTVELMLQKFDHCQSVPDREVENKTSPMACTLVDVQTCLPSLEKPPGSKSEACETMKETTSCIESILSYCDGTQKVAIEQMLSEFQSQIRARCSNERTSPSVCLDCTTDVPLHYPCSGELCRDAYRGVINSSEDACQAMIQMKACLHGHYPHCEPRSKIEIASLLKQDEDMGIYCPHRIFTSCTEEDITLCVTDMINLDTAASSLKTCEVAEKTTQCFDALTKSGECSESLGRHVKRLQTLTNRVVSLCDNHSLKRNQDMAEDV